MSNRKKVNVVFTQKVDLLQSQWRALEMISLELSKASSQNRKQSLKPKKQSNALSNGLEDASGPLIVPGKGSSQLQNDWSRRMLFPNESDGVLQTSLRRFPHGSFFDAAINFEQAHAINAVYKNEYGTIPYLISGPPGTGKTKTIVETAMQFLNNTDNAHLLICAPSEAAADTLALRLKKYLNTPELLRLNRSARADNEVPGELLQYCYMEDSLFALPPLKALMSYKVVVTSCRDAAILADARITNSDLYSVERNVLSTLHPNIPVPELSLHWDALFIDEAAQATEMDVLPAISVICPPSDYPAHRPQPRFIMAGDEHQLGPRTASRDPLFSTSLFARLFDRPLYKDHPLARSKVKPSSGPPVLKRSMLPIITPPFTLLIRNYRSHPSILSVPSSLFYHDTLIPEASPDPSSSKLLQASSLWRGRKWPILFLPHNKPDEIERDGGGWYNNSEARLACALAQQLVSESRVDQADICIMAPFAAQVKVLRNLIRSKKYGNGKGLWDVNIGPLEAFQGLEKRVVILCTTRTRERFLEKDEKQGLGIVHQARKMNVALTRAMEGLFVIGNPALLGKDEHWRAWMAFCWRNGMVDGREGVWKGEEEWVGKGKVGVLERALLAKQSHVQQSGKRALGVSASDDLARDEYEAWTESLRQALEEEEEEEEEEGEEWDGEEGAEGEWAADDREGGIDVEVHELDGNTE
ncbi:P-loop containing nucleoside triphosphate hydrolase protein [Pyrenochaeta sp. DS3sAY3a]|nr:P-loop containing nucleoside triphosphate hydrolase protein [Pyrenochaeta sp. DS3sAY3a]